MDAADLIDRDLHLRPRGFWTSAQHPVIGETRFHAPVARIAGTPVPRPSPTLGQHNEEVFGGLLGLSIDEIRELGTAGVLK